MFSMLFIYPLDHDTYGTLQFVVSITMLLFPFASFGIPNLIIKFFTDYKEKCTDVRSILPSLLVFSVVNAGIFSILYLIFNDSIYSGLNKAGFDETLLKENQIWILCLMLLMIVIQAINSYISNYGRIVIPIIVQEFGYKLFIPCVILVIYFGFLSGKVIGPALVLFYAIAIFLLLIYAKSLKILTWQPNFKYFFDPVNRLKVLSYGFFTSLTSLGAMLAFKLDSIMITTLLSAEQNGLYFNVFLMANVIDMPVQAISKVAGPVISESWAKNDTLEINSIYKKSSLVNQIVGSLIFLGILVNLENLFAISSKPEAFAGAIMLFIVLGAAKLIDGIAGLNSQILVYSKAYRYNLFFLSFLGVLSVFTNYYFIPMFGLFGAGLATFFSLIIFNLVKLLFLKFKYDMQPLTWQTLVVLGIALLTGFIVFNIPFIGNHFIAMFVKSSLVVLLFFGPIYFFKISPDINKAVQTFVLDRFKK